MTANADVTVSNHGSIILFRPITQAAEAWFDHSVEAAASQWFGGALAVEPRYAPALHEGLVEDGFIVEPE